MDSNLHKQLLFLVSNNSGFKLEKIIEQIFESNLYNTNDILEHENVKNLNTPEASNKYYNTLKLYTKDNYFTFKNNPQNYLELNDKMKQKLKILTLLDLIKENKNLKIDEICKVLDIVDPFEFDLIIFEGISLGLLNAKVDQKNKLLKVLSVRGRNHVSDISNVEHKLDKWIHNFDNSTLYIEQEIESLRNENRNFNENLSSNVASFLNANQKI